MFLVVLFLISRLVSVFLILLTGLISTGDGPHTLLILPYIKMICLDVILAGLNIFIKSIHPQDMNFGHLKLGARDTS